MSMMIVVAGEFTDLMRPEEEDDSEEISKRMELVECEIGLEGTIHGLYQLETYELNFIYESNLLAQSTTTWKVYHLLTTSFLSFRYR